MKSNATFFHTLLLAAPMAFLPQGIVLAQSNQLATTSHSAPVAEASGVAFREGVDFRFWGGQPQGFLYEVDRQYKVDWHSVAQIPSEMQNVSIPTLRLNPKSPPVPTGRQRILQKLQTIPYYLDNYELGASLIDVIKDLQKNSKKSDLDGINFQFNPYAGGNAWAANANATATAVAGPAPDPKDIVVRISPPLYNLTLNEALGAICKMAELPAGTPSSGLTYSIDDNVVWFFLKPNGSAGGTGDSGAGPGSGLSGSEVPQRDPLEALIALYNSLPGLGKLIVEGDLAKPSIVMFQPTPSAPVTDVKMKAFPLRGIPTNEWPELAESARQDLRILGQEQGLRPAGDRFRVELERSVGLLVVFGPDSVLQAAESFVTAWQSNRSPIGHGSDVLTRLERGRLESNGSPVGHGSDAHQAPTTDSEPTAK